MLKTIHLIQGKKINWYNVTKSQEVEIEELKKKFNFQATDLQDCLPPPQRPKLIQRDDYIFMILLFPVYHRLTREIKATEVDFFIGKDYIVTVHDSELVPLMEIYQEAKENSIFVTKFLADKPTALIQEIIERLLLYLFPMLTHISNDIDQIEERIFSGEEREMVKEILLIKRNIVNFRKTMQAHKNIIQRLVSSLPQVMPVNNKLDADFSQTVEHAKDVWAFLENFKDTIDALHHTNESLISFRLNQIMKTLTIFSVIVFPLTLLAAIFGMNTTNMPLVSLNYGFWIILLMMTLGTFGMLMIFKGKKWL